MIFYEPLIEPHNYDAFRRLLHADIPSSYDVWLNLQAKESEGRVMKGHKVRQVKVDPDEFARYCRATGAGHSLNSLRGMVEKISGGAHRY
jgi:hypothetical protein